ncbi:arginine--tRNA ligase [Akkermansiaceae bacterium]|nr:arginine--tRNA ligase [Akkermansiaceae bacterium]MDB4471495.1 arginine--tRNA ligase [Akkermansiaceae bacterium]MDB4483434.1 arginine--tRNA ligase [Akkermansiaceae bacterium]MDB4525104.1 arginine--tRNA ligase [bacterium]
MTIPEILREKVLIALESLEVEVPDPARVQVTKAADLRFGDFQSNIAMMLAKGLGKNPREFAEDLSGRIAAEDLCEISIAGPGFLNFTLKAEAWADLARAQWESGDLSVSQVEAPQTIVVDFSAPNVAKPMHVGHIRSTIIGECLSRVAIKIGHKVIKDNHIGDWGTQFGMVTWAWKKGVDEERLETEPLQELLRLYRTASDASKDDEGTKEECRAELVKLQQGDPENKAIWERCLALSRKGLNQIYDRLDVSFDHWMGESAYNDALAPLVEQLIEDDLARESDGAICIFSNEAGKPKHDPFKINRDGEWQDFPMMIRKSDGAFNYATTDIATVQHRVKEWNADHIWYVVDFRQGGHFSQLFDTSKRLGHEEVNLVHVAFGTILGKDGKPLKTRAGDLPQLEDVLNDAVKAAQIVVDEKSHLDTAEEKAALAELIGVNSVKFTELSHHRMSDYVFDLDKMVALEGDTAPYLLYSYVRSRSIFRKLDGKVELKGGNLRLTEKAEIHLVRMLTRYSDQVHQVVEDYRPNLLATYLLELARAFHSFFEACPVLKSEGKIRESRLILCDLTSRVLKDGLELLAISVPERM